MTLACRRMVAGRACGTVLKSDVPIGLMGDIDASNGVVMASAGGLRGRCVAGTVLVAPYTIGSGGAWRVLYQLARRNVAPVAIILAQTPGPTLIQGAILARIPVVRLLDPQDFASFQTDERLTVDADAQCIRFGA